MYCTFSLNRVFFAAATSESKNIHGLVCDYISELLNLLLSLQAPQVTQVWWMFLIRLEKSISSQGL